MQHVDIGVTSQKDVTCSVLGQRSYHAVFLQRLGIWCLVSLLLYFHVLFVCLLHLALPFLLQMLLLPQYPLFLAPVAVGCWELGFFVVLLNSGSCKELIAADRRNQRQPESQKRWKQKPGRQEPRSFKKTQQNHKIGRSLDFVELLMNETREIVGRRKASYDILRIRKSAFGSHWKFNKVQFTSDKVPPWIFWERCPKKTNRFPFRARCGSDVMGSMGFMGYGHPLNPCFHGGMTISQQGS